MMGDSLRIVTKFLMFLLTSLYFHSFYNYCANMYTDVVKTRQQRQVVVERIAPKYHGVLQSCILIAQEEGIIALWKGIGPRLARIMPGQAITFATYESVSKQLSQIL